MYKGLLSNKARFLSKVALFFITMPFVLIGCENYNESVFELYNATQATILIKELTIDDKIYFKDLKLVPIKSNYTSDDKNTKKEIQIRLSETKSFDLKVIVYDTLLNKEIQISEKLAVHDNAGTHFVYGYRHGWLGGSLSERMSVYD